MAFLTPLALLGLALIIPVLLLYMLRLRRREVVISSTFLWQQVLRDHEANTPWQKLRRSLLLIVQLLALIILVLALARPFVVVPGISTARTAILIDASASMNATDSPDGSRFAEAQRRAREIVETLNAGAEASILRVGATVEVAAGYTADRAALLAAIDSLPPGDGGADWDTALTLAGAASADAAALSSFAVVLISDGGAISGASLPAIDGEFQYVRVGSSGDNTAIAALAVRTLPGAAPELFARLTNYGAEAVEVIFDLRVDGELFTAERKVIPGNSSLSYVLDSPLPDSFTTVQASITRPAEAAIPDHLAADDTAFAVAPAVTTRRVLLLSASGSVFLEQALRTLPGVAVFTADPAGGLPAGTFDVYVFDGWLPPDLPTADLLIVNPPTDTPLFTLGTPVTIETDAAALAAPRLVRAGTPGLDLSLVEAAGGIETINIGAFTPVTADWAQPILAVDGGALVQAGTRSGQQIAVFGVDLRATDLPLQIAFPALMAALIDWYAPQDAIDAPSTALTGEGFDVRLPSGAASARLTLPDGTVREAPVERATWSIIATDQAGLYRIDALDRAGDVLATAWTAVNAYRADESDLLPREVVRLGDTTIDGVPPEQTGQRELWPWAAALALIVITLEWWLYHRRSRLPAAFRPLRRQT